MEIILVAVVGALCIVCFFVGAKVGQTVARGEKIEVPEVNPIKKIQEHKGKKLSAREQDRLDTILQNIDNYDGTSYGQKDVPMGVNK